jgi:hypothetical protein
MSRFVRGLGGLVLGLGLVLIVQGHPVQTALADSTGRNFSRCVKSCNDTGKACGNRCDATCDELFPGRGQDFRDCKAECKTSCGVESDDCKLVCENIKNPPSPEEP